MPHSSLKIIGGAVQNETPALNVSGIADCNLIRFKTDGSKSDFYGLISLPEKIGGWSKFWSVQVTNGPIRALWPYQDTEARKWLIYGTDNSVSAQLEAVECFTNPLTGLTNGSANGNQYFNITPQVQSDSVPALFVTVSGSNIVTVTDPVITGVTQYDTVFITTPVSVGGIVLSGMYAVSPTFVSDSQYEIAATDILGNPTPAAYSTVASPLVVTGATYSGGPPATITLHWSSPSYTFPVGEAVVVNGVAPGGVNGTWLVTGSTTTSVTFDTTLGSFTWASGGTISNYGTVPIFSTVSASNSIDVEFPDHGYNVGDTFYVLNPTVVNGITLFGDYKVISVIDGSNFTINGPQTATSTGYQFQAAQTVTGGSANGTDVTLTIGAATFIEPSIAVTGGTGNGTDVTLTWATPAYDFTAGQTIVVSGINPANWGGAYTVISATSGSVTYANTHTGPYVSGGTIINAPFNVGAPIWVSGVNPTDWNGWFTVAAVTATTVSYANTSASHAWVSGGSVSDNGGDAALIYNIGIGPAQAGSGFGVGGFGVGGFGTGTTIPAASGQNVAAINWELGNWGDIALALPIGSFPITYGAIGIPFQPIYTWDPTNGQVIAQAITAGPQANMGMFVAMPERQIVAWGSTFSGVVDPLLIRWCDINDFTDWVAQVTNQAGSFRLSSGAEIRGALQTPQQGLIWTDIELWSMQYINQPLVYGFNKIGQGCGLIARHAAASLNGLVYWMSNEQFFMLSGSGVQPIVCPIWDVVYQNLDLANVRKITCAANSLFQEITWYYPAIGAGGEVSNYIQFNTILSVWSFGKLSRSAWTDVSVMGQPIGADPGFEYIYQHEISPDADGVAMLPYFTTGYFALSDGDQQIYTDEYWPDMKWGYYGHTATASVNITFSVTNFPGIAPQTYGPYTVTQQTQWINPRFRGRLVSMTIGSSDLGSFWRVGIPRYRIQPDGRY